MSLVRAVTIIGDSNVKHNLTSHNCKGRPLMSGVQFVQCGRLLTLEASLKSVREESDVCVLSCLTNFLCVKSANVDTSSRAETTLKSALEKITAFSSTRPETRFLVCPPMYRLSPNWYRAGISDILIRFSSIFSSLPENVLLMPSFPGPDFQADGVHLTSFSGGEFLLHMFENIEAVVSMSVAPIATQVRLAKEESRSIGDRVAVLEKESARVNLILEHKSIIDSELFDLQENLRNEAFFMIQGLARLPRLDPKAWQDKAKADVSEIIRTIMGQDLPVSFVQNSTGRGKDAKTLYRVKMESPEASRSVRMKFGSFFSNGKDARPATLAGISIRNCVTPGTLARIAVLQLLGRRYKESNPGSRFQVIGYEARPVLKLTPPPGVADKRVKSFNYVEAIESLPTNFTKPEVEGLIRRISPKLFGNLKSTLGVLDDDMLPKRSAAAENEAGSDRSGSESTPPPQGSRKSFKRGPPSSGSGVPAAKK